MLNVCVLMYERLCFIESFVILFFKDWCVDGSVRKDFEETSVATVYYG